MDVNEAIDDLYSILGQHNGEYMDYASYEAAVDNLNIISIFVTGTRWIPVSERLPTEKDANINGLVHVWLKDGNCDYEDWQDVARYAERYQRVTHWMPLPEPPGVE